MGGLVALGWLLVAGPPTLAPATFDNFERSELGPGWPGWGEPLGPAAERISLSTELTPRGRAGRLRYRQALRHVMIPAPAVTLTGQPVALHLHLQGDRSGNLLSANLLDASGEWLNTEPLKLDFKGWKRLTLDLTRIRASAHGDGDGRADPPVSLLSVNLEFVGASEGELWLDDVWVEQRPVPAVDYLDLDLTGLARARVFSRGEEPEVLLTNRSPSSIPVRVEWRCGAQHAELERLPAPGQTIRLPVKLDDVGPRTVAVAARTEGGELKRSFEVALLPDRVGGPDTFLGLGEHSLTDIVAGRFAGDLAALRAAGADWTRIAFPARPGDPALAAPDWADVGRALTLAWAERIRVVGYLAAAIPGVAAGGRGPYLESLAWLETSFGQDVGAWQVRADAPAGAASLVAGARGVLRPGRPILWTGAGTFETGAGPDGVVVELAGGDGPLDPGLPRAWQRLFQAAAAGPGPVWLWARSWPLAELTGTDDRAAAIAVILACARATPNVVAAGWGRLRDDATGPGLLGRDDDLRPEYLAFAVSSRLIGGLECAGIRSPETGLFVATFGRSGPVVEVLWSSGAEHRVASGGAVLAFDCLGGALPAGQEVVVGVRPVYLVRSLG